MFSGYHLSVMANPLLRRRNITYRVCITVLEARHLRQNANPLVVVKVGDRTRKSMTRKRTDCPVFNEYFVFDLTGNLEVFLATRVSIAVYLRGFLGHLEFYAATAFDVATIWDQPDHRFYHKWLILTNPSDPTGGPRGYVKCNMVVLVKGETLKMHGETDGEDDIEGNLFPPVGDGSLPFRQRARYIFGVYRADGLPANVPGVCGFGRNERVNPYVQISFAGLKGRTSYARGTQTARFNEVVIFRELFPPLSHRIRVALKHRVDGCRSRLLASRVLDLREISNSGEYGFLPTYGPSFLHMYGSGCAAVENECHAGGLPPYRGRVLLSLRTEMDDPEASPRKSVETEPTDAIIEENLWRKEDYAFVAILYDTSMIDRRRFSSKPVSFEVTIGDVGDEWLPRRGKKGRRTENEAGGDSTDETRMPERGRNRTDPRRTATLDGKYNYLPLATRKPVLYLGSSWPNVEWRMRNSNDLFFIADFLAERLERLDELTIVGGGRAHELYNQTMRTLRDHCERYLDALDRGEYETHGGTTKLDRHRVNMCRNAVESILKRIRVNGELTDDRYIEIATTHGYKYLRELEELRKDPQDGLPDVFVWMLVRSKRVACARIPAESIVYSEEPRKRGRMCGETQKLFMANPPGGGDSSDYRACTIEIFLWLGAARYLPACWSAIPAGYDVEHDGDSKTFPRYLEYAETSAFQLRAHIFQGRFDPSMNASGLLDPFVTVTFHGYTLATRPIKRSLDPFWDQTLLFPVVRLCADPEHLRSAPPRVILQVFDQDLCGARTFCGRCTASPSVKLAHESHASPDFPPKLSWYKLESSRDDCNGAILAAFELTQSQDEDEAVAVTTERIYGIPNDIRPRMAKYRIEVIFWGVRDMKRIACMPVLKPRIIVECAGIHVKSEVMENARKFPNFEEPHIVVELDMPELEIYYPCVTITGYDSRGFGRFKYLGICVIPTVRMFLEELITEEEYRMQIYQPKFVREDNDETSSRFAPVLPLTRGETRRVLDIASRVRGLVSVATRYLKGGDRAEAGRKRAAENVADGEEIFDWWSRYHASLEARRSGELGVTKDYPAGRLTTFEIYPSELEAQPQFQAFQDRLTSFELRRGGRNGAGQRDDGGRNFAGKFKGHISVYRWPHPEKLPCKTRSGRDAANGLCDDYPTQEPAQLLVRLYVVKGIDLHPCDPFTGKSDPYLVVRLGPRTVTDRKNYIANQLNPTFGRLFEMEATLPRDYMLRIQVWDHDLTSSDDLIGETRIDIENRFYSRHRACCGISREYNATGCNAWRDRERPTQILEFLCKKSNLPAPVYREGEVRIGRRQFPYDGPKSRYDEQSDREERMALSVLHRWQDFPICGCALVPEHVERRPLFNPGRPGLVQGTLELWVDMFHASHLPPKPATNISPQVPEEYEIRVIVWNTDDVPLVDSQFLTGEKCSDIYVKGWLVYENYQRTDIHYNSLTGEGNFNWRFVFRVMYLMSERVMIVRKKTSILARDETEQKLPCRLHLQVWDSDHLSPDDFLGALTLDLSRMPRGSSNPRNCSAKLLDPRLPTVNLFQIGRMRGWWPFTRSEDGKKSIRAGKVELEITVLRGVEANAKPVGRGRDSPQSLPAPRRPETSFSWFRNPWKAFRYVICRHYKWRIIVCLLCIMLLLLLACAVYAFPGYLVKRLLGA